MTASRTSRRALLVAAAAAALAATSCGDPPAPYGWKAGSPVHLDVTFREELLPVHSSREVSLSADGRVTDGTTLALTISFARHERKGATGEPVRIDTSDTAVPVADRSPEDVATARVLSGLVGRNFELEFDAADGLRSARGLDAALDAAVPPDDAAAADAASGLRGVLADTSVVRALRAAGLCEVPRNFRDASEPMGRRAEVRVPGRGVTGVVLRGRAGFEKDGGPVLRLAGQMGGVPEFRGEPGDPPPPEVGEVVVSRIEGDGETLYGALRPTPLRGRVTLRLPFASGATVLTSASFALVPGE